MSKRRSEPEDSRPTRPADWLPAFFAILFSTIGLYFAIFELSPAFEEHRAVRAALRAQIDSKARLDAEISDKERQLRSLVEDPQATQQELDKRGLLPEGKPGEALGSGSESPDRGQSGR